VEEVYVMGRPSPYSGEFRADAVRLVVDSTPPRPINDVALELGLNRETLRSWVRRSEKEAASLTAGGLTAAEREELKALRRRVKVLEEEKEILRKATQYFVREMNRSTVATGSSPPTPRPTPRTISGTPSPACARR
jgi:transposase